MSDLGTDGTRLYQSRIDGATVRVTTDGVVRVTPAAPALLLGDRLAVSPTGDIAVCARTAADRAYASVNLGPWIDLGRTAQPICVWWMQQRFIFALLAPGGGSLLEYEVVAGVPRLWKTTPIPGGTSQGLLYYDEGLTQFVITSPTPTIVGTHTLYHAVRRMVGGRWFTHGQQVGTPDVNAIATADGVHFVTGPQTEIPQLIAIGTTLYTNGGKAWPSPYPGEPVPLPPNPPPPTLEAPGVQVLAWAPIDSDKTGLLVQFLDRNNPQFGTVTVTLDGGYIRVEIVNTVGRDKSSKRDRKVI